MTPESRTGLDPVIGRRGLLRGAAIGGVGLAGAALIGCGTSNSSSSATGTAAAGGAGASATAAAATAAATQAAEQPKKGGTLSVDSSASVVPRTLIFGFTPGNRYIRDNVWETLIEIGDGYKPAPVLADTFQFNKDSSAVHVVLKKGVQFHDGRPLTADDVKFSIGHYMGKTANGQLKGPLNKNVKDVTVVDPQTLDITFNGPAPTMVDIFALMLIVDKNTVDSVVKMEKVNGTGPFKLTNFTPDQGYQLDRNPNYWDPNKPYLDTLQGKVYADDDARMLALQTGELMHVSNLSYSTIAKLQSSSKVKIVSLGKIGDYYFGLVTDKPPFNDQRMRQAMLPAIDRNRIAKQWSQGVITGDALPWPDGSVGAKTSDASWLDYNPDKAKQLIQQAGASGATFDIAITPVGGQDTIAQFIQDDLKQVGLNANLQKLEYAAFLDQLRGKKFAASAWVAVAGFAQTIDPATMILVAQLYPEPNPSHYQSSAYTDLLKQIPTADPNTPEGLSVFKQFNQLAFRDDPWVPPLTGRPDFHVMTAKVHGDTGNVNGKTSRAKDWWIA